MSYSEKTEEVSDFNVDLKKV